MEQDKNRSITPSRGGMFRELGDRIRLVLRLMSDSRVSLWLKLLPSFSLVYLVIPDIAPGPIDDAAIIWLGFTLFVELCPPDVVLEHQRALNPELPEIQKDPLDEPAEIIDAEYWDES